MSTVKANTYQDASGGNTATINSMTPTADSLQGFRNRIINGDMRIDQRNAGASVTVGTSGGYYPVDRFFGQASAASKFTLQQSSDVPSGQGFTNSVVATSSSAYSITSSDYFIIRQAIEGLNCYDLMFGSANAKTVTLSFWAKSSLTGTFSGHLTNSSSARWYPFTYTISSANTWTQISVTIAGDTSGTWLTNNNTGIYVGWSMGTGTSNQATANAWTASTGIAATGSVNLVATNSATFYITGVQLEVGSTATPFERRDYGRELIMCQRYYYRIQSATGDPDFGVGWNESTTVASAFISFPVSMRTAPTALEQTGTASNYQVVVTVTAVSCSSVPTFEKGATWGSRVRGTVSSGLTAGQGSALRMTNNSNAYLAWSAEL